MKLCMLQTPSIILSLERPLLTAPDLRGGLKLPHLVSCIVLPLRPLTVLQTPCNLPLPRAVHEYFVSHKGGTKQRESNHMSDTPAL